MSTVEKDPQLNGLLWDEVKSHLQKDAEEWNSLRKTLADKVGKNLENLFAAYFAQHPYVEALAFSLTSAEYDDEGYGGFNFVSMRPKFNHKDLSEETRSYLNQVEDEWDAGYIEPVDWSYVRSVNVPDEIRPALTKCSEMNSLLDSVATFARDHWGECGVKVTPKKISLFYSSEDLT